MLVEFSDEEDGSEQDGEGRRADVDTEEERIVTVSDEEVHAESAVDTDQESDSEPEEEETPWFIPEGYEVWGTCLHCELSRRSSTPLM